MNHSELSSTASAKSGSRRGLWAVALTSLCLLASGPGLAEKPDWAGGGKHGKEGRGHQGERERGAEQGGYSQAPSYQNGPHVEVRVGGDFADSQRQAAQTYFGNEYRSGNCPPGLAKKNNGCLPPGQAKRYRVGQPLPADLVYYPLPPAVVVQLGAPPAGHRYVRVAADILLIAVGTGMVVDAIGDLGRF